ncbi:carbon-monoxide dehydrogenase large subunit [Tistlia consotensis]|uniref:Carbon-monoxide dehydrogenase large subunit n=1 Tax=Tistlia consotensis USBA 355 TaxID=560819 RepID=A0A1Y6C9K4_9PROT|nr:xanthine dehydrogenase family protein molybdopterin-binding subunit [Tistlia consotensis]SMF49049.1 carbon-monoxide dehydrogenase large subunit [Tistlia consotensis USBA 355]SNR80488.1 carbon-monoxide dehydrogenase large subunit [Tistlia consotensis]
MKFGLGQSIRRVEDQRFLTGHGCYTDDLVLPGALVATLVRSPVAHGRLLGLEVGRARSMPGVAAVLTCADLERLGVGCLPIDIQPPNADGTPCFAPPRPLLAEGKVRYVGEPLALIVAETLAQALDAAETIEPEIEELPAVVDADAAMAPGAPALYDALPDNCMLRFEDGDAAAVEAAFDGAAHRVALEVVNNRVVVASMEPRNAIGEYDAETGRYTLTTTSQGAQMLRDSFVEAVLGVPKEQVRIVTPDVGGGFGMKAVPYPEQGLVLVAAKLTGRPVRWQESRSEAFLADTQGRDNLSSAELALDAEGRFLALKVHTRAAVGGALSAFGAYCPTLSAPPMAPGVYAIPAVHSRVELAFTNQTPIDAYRGAGRPEAAYLIERLVDEAARSLGFDAAELRRRNFVPKAAMPFTTATGIVYDSGDFVAVMETALARADWAGAAARKRAAAAAGRLRGIGLAYYIERTGAGPEEAAHLALGADGSLEVFVGTQSSGQGHETVFTQLLAERLGLAPERIRVRSGDTEHPLPMGGGTVGSRSMVHGGGALNQASDSLIAKARVAAADLLEAAEADLEFAAGAFTVVGTDRVVTLVEVAAKAGGLAATETFVHEPGTFPNGAHVCELEVDPETGTIEILRYTVVDDFGRVLNPALLAGQIHGGIAQGIGQAMLEHTAYDPESGQLLSGSFLDYAMPRADDLPDFEIATQDVPCATNALGVKGAGEAGAIGAPPALVNAALDALAPLGVTRLDMPLTPLRVWQAMRAAGDAAR